MVEHDLSWFPGEIKYQYFHCYSCEKAIFIVFIHHLYIFLIYTTVSISFQKLNSSKTKPWLNMVYHKLLGENVWSDVMLRLKHDLLIFYYLCLMSNKIRWYLSLRFAPNNKKISQVLMWLWLTMYHGQLLFRHHCHDTVNHGQTWLAIKNNGTMVILTPGWPPPKSLSSLSLLQSPAPCRKAMLEKSFNQIHEQQHYATLNRGRRGGCSNDLRHRL